MNKKYGIIFLLTLLFVPLPFMAQDDCRWALPNRGQLSSDKVLFVMQDSEGFLWYATEGGGVCRDDGRQVDVFRSDAEHPDLLGSNTVLCLAESGNRILIGTTHGASVLDKSDYSIRRLAEVDDRRVDDILVASGGNWWLTANRKVYEYSADGRLLRTIDAGDKYIFRLYEDSQGQLLCRQWEGGTLRLDGERLVQVGDGWADSIDFRRISTDNKGNKLVADGFGGCHVLGRSSQKCWFDGSVLTKETADSVRRARALSERPTALAVGSNGNIWFSTGKDIRCKGQDGEEKVVSNIKDISAIALAPDGTMWFASIFGHLYRYSHGETRIDDYATNEYGDGVTAMSVDSAGRVVMLSDRYVRIYDPVRKTLRQQSREACGTYMIELQETAPSGRWSQPMRDRVKERLPGWMWWMLAGLLLVLSALVCHILMLHQQRRLFMQQMRSDVCLGDQSMAQSAVKMAVSERERQWLQRAIAQVEAHLDDEGYTVEQLSSDMCMSRMTFYRKIQSATGYTPSEFVRTIRLRRAAELLRKGGMSVTEISYATGFSSVSYFSRCFRKMFGMSPTQFSGSTSAEP